MSAFEGAQFNHSCVFLCDGSKYRQGRGVMQGRLGVLWLESPVKLWLNGTKPHSRPVSSMFLVMQSLCLMSHTVCETPVQFLSCPCGAAPVLTPFCVCHRGGGCCCSRCLPDSRGAAVLPCSSLLCWGGFLHSL